MNAGTHLMQTKKDTYISHYSLYAILEKKIKVHKTKGYIFLLDVT